MKSYIQIVKQLIIIKFTFLYIKYQDLYYSVKFLGYTGFIFWRMKFRAVNDPEYAARWATKIRNTIAVMPNSVSSENSREAILNFADILDEINIKHKEFSRQLNK